ncbi:MAG: hypothetical protein QXR84_09475 [Candidatus Bathyarchaeia archaeon]
MRIKDKIKIDNIVTIQLIDKKTGKVVSEKTGRNVVLSRCSADLLSVIRGVWTVVAWDDVNIFTPTKTFIKTISGSYTTVQPGTGYNFITLTAQDTSNDTYTCRYFGLCYESQSDFTLQSFAYDYGSNLNKGSDQTLRVTWEIRIAYSSPP